MAKTSINYDKLETAKASLKSIRATIKQSGFLTKNFKCKKTTIKNNLSEYDLVNVLRKKCVYRISPDITQFGSFMKTFRSVAFFDNHSLLEIDSTNNNSLDFEKETVSYRESGYYNVTYMNAPIKKYWSYMCDDQNDFSLAPLITADAYKQLNKYLKSYTENINNLYSSYANIQSALNVVCDDIDKAIRKINKMINAYKGLEKQNNKKFGDRSATKVQKQLTTLLKYGVSAKEIKSIAKELGYKVKISHKAVSILSKIKKKSSSSSSRKTSVSTTASTTSKTTASKKAKHSKSKVAVIAKLKKDLKKALKDGKKAKAFSIYKSLVGLVGTTKAKSYLSGLGYKVGKNSDGVKVIKQVKQQSTTSTKDTSKTKTKTQTTKSNSNNNANKNSNPAKPNSGTTNDSGKEDSSDNNDNNNEPTTNVSGDGNTGVEKQPSNESVATPSDDNTTLDSNVSNNNSSRVSNVSNNNNYSDNNSGDSGLVFDGEESDGNTSSIDESNLVPSDTEDDSSVDDTISETPSKKVKTLEDDTPKSTSSSKSGLGVAVPLGLGVVATGAAAVAGARYIKNKKDSSYEDENYDDEDNNLDEDSSYTDTSSDYSSDDYMNDNYLGPAGSSYIDTNLDETSDSSDAVDNYIDSEEFENDTNDEEDLVLKDLN